MGDCRVWDIVRIPFPYTRRPVQQYRPALVIAERAEPGDPRLLWVLMITSAANRRWSGDVPVSNLERAGLPAASVVRTAKIVTLEADAASRIGYLEEADRQKVSERIRRLLHPAGICQS